LSICSGVQDTLQKYLRLELRNLVDCLQAPPTSLVLQEGFMPFFCLPCMLISASTSISIPTICHSQRPVTTPRSLQHASSTKPVMAATLPTGPLEWKWQGFPPSQNFWIWRTPPNSSVDQGWHRKHDGAKWRASLYLIELASIVAWFEESAHVAL
jgi:hypothetical protein